MASVTISSVPLQVLPSTTIITGEEKLVAINKQGKPAAVSVNQILDKVDDTIADRVEDQVMEQIMESVDEQIDNRIDSALDNLETLTWNEIL